MVFAVKRPPLCGSRSTTTTRFPRWSNSAAPSKPPRPAPITIASKALFFCELANESGAGASTVTPPAPAGNCLYMYLPGRYLSIVFSNHAAQQTVAFSHSIENTLMQLEHLVQLTCFARQFCHILDVAWIVHHIFHQLQQFGPGQSFTGTRNIRDRLIHAFRDSAHANSQLISSLGDISIVSTQRLLRSIELLLQRHHLSIQRRESRH